MFKGRDPQIHKECVSLSECWCCATSNLPSLGVNLAGNWLTSDTRTWRISYQTICLLLETRHENNLLNWRQMLKLVFCLVFEISRTVVSYLLDSFRLSNGFLQDLSCLNLLHRDDPTVIVTIRRDVEKLKCALLSTLTNLESTWFRRRTKANWRICFCGGRTAVL